MLEKERTATIIHLILKNFAKDVPAVTCITGKERTDSAPTYPPFHV